MERKFLVLLRRFSLRKEHYYFIIFDCSFLRSHGDRGAPVSAFSGNSKLCASDQVQLLLFKWIVLGTNKSYCACPALPVRAQIPAVFRRYYKTAEIAPFNTSYPHKIHICPHKGNHFYPYADEYYYHVCF